MKRFVVNILSCILACVVFVFGGVCVANADAKFTLTTTTGQTTFSFSLSVIGTFTVDCSDGGVLSGTGVSGNTITRSNTTKATYTCTWKTGDRHTIWFDGEATGYNTGTSTAAISFYVNSSNTKIALIDGNLSSMFPYISNNAATGAQPRFYQTFYNATNLTQIPETLFADYTTGANYMFLYTFYGCSGLTSIPEKLFSNIENTTNATYLFSNTFSGCSGLTTIPEDLFSSITTGTSYMFQSTFNSCSGLTSIPEKLFSNIENTTNATYLFSNTFSGCSGLTTIPEDLFSSITTGTMGMFQSTFYMCSGLTSIPEKLFSNIENTTNATYLFSSTFYGCSGLTTIPEDLFSSITTGTSYMFQSTFNSCSGLTSIPEKLFSNIENTTNATYLFSNTFSGCGGLTTIPEDLFSSITTGTMGMFQSTFYYCKGLTTIPEDLFSSITTGASYMFQSTFNSCSGLTTIPEDLFSSITTGASYMFQTTFNSCSGLTSIPEDLFSSITTGASYMFSGTFQSCNGLVTIPGNLFSSVTTSASYMFDSTFSYCSGLTTIPGDLFSSITTGAEGLFRYTFRYCGGLTSISENLFSSVTTGARYMFDSTFEACSKLITIPGNLFSNITTGQYYMFRSTFQSCSGLTTVPGSLFSGITTGAEGMFSYTFRNCINLTNVPENLFAGIETVANYMFSGTFYNCSNLSGYIPSSTFAGLIAKNHPTASYMWSSTFNSTKLWTSCSEHGLEQYITGYEGSGNSTWNGKVSCVPGNITYVLNGGVNYSNAPYGYVEGTGVVIDGIPTKAGHVFTGWCTDSELTSCAMGQTIGADATGDKIFYAKWTECTACATINASCAISVVNNVCTYATSCDNEYGNIQNNGQYNASCSALAQYNITYIVDGGTNYANAPTSYYETVGTTVNGIPTKDGFVFAGWCTDSELTSCAMGQTIGADATGDKIFYAKWTECTACATTNASCAISVVNNVCKYVTSCNAGYGNIQNNGQYNASCVLPSDIIYVMNGGTNYANALTGYYEGVGVTINYVPTKLEHMFAGWCTDSELENCAMSQTIGTTATGPQTFYAKWTECPACATINASCAFASVENNVCKYNTVCNDGYYKITNNGSYNASCLPCGDINYYCTGGVRTAVSARYYSTGGTETTRTGQSQCESGYYCANGARNECPSGYENSAAGATAANQCYRACSTVNFEHSITVSGNDYYDDGKDTCTAETCESGYVTQLVSADLSTLDTSINGTAYGYVNNSGSTTSATPYGLTSSNINTWGVLFSYGKVLGESSCKASYYSTQTGQYCYCRVSGYVGGDTNTSRLTGTILPASFDTWNYRNTYNSTGACTSSCAYNCAYETMRTASYRSQLFNAAGSGVSQCVPEIYNITYVLDGGTNYNNAPTTYEYAAGATIDGAPTKPGTIFAGWCTDEQLQNCAMSQTIGTSATGDKTFYAKWTECEAGYYCENNVKTKCPSGYDNSVAGAVAANQCYHACTTSNVKHSTTVSGNDYYDNGKDTCTAETCETGYVMQSTVDLNSLNLDSMSSYGYITTNYNSVGKDTYGLINEYTWGASFNSGKLIGESLCSITSGTANQPGNPDTNTTDQYCWCRATGWVDGDTHVSRLTGTIQPISHPTWVLLGSASSLSGSLPPVGGGNMTATSKCSWNCVYYCVYNLQGNSVFRRSIVTASSGDMINRCFATITYVLNGGTNYSDAPVGYEEGNGTIVNGVPTKEGAVFAGWCTDAELQNCAMSQTIDKNATGNKTFYAKWTECSACSPTNASCTFDGIVNNVCTYTTSCNTGYGNIQNNGKYNASCSLSTYNITYDLTGGVSCIAYCNLFDNQWAQGGGYWYNDNNGNYSKRIHAVNLIPVTPNTTYTVSRTGNLRLAVQQYANTVKSSTSNPCLQDSGWVSSSTTTYTFTTLSNTRYVWLQLSSNNYSTDITPANGEATNVQFELGNVAHAFVPYVENCNAATVGNNCGTNYANAPTTYTFGTGATIDGVPTREDAVFAGWCTDAELQNCAMSQTIGTSATGDKTFYAKWTECPACAATNASCTFDGVVNNVCTYTTSCNTGYGDIQNNGQYNASCSANDITLVYQDGEGNEISTGSCEYGTVISLPDAPTKQGYKFKGWTVVPAE